MSLFRSISLRPGTFYFALTTTNMFIDSVLSRCQNYPGRRLHKEKI
jgi:hypothetical protein